MDLIPGARSIDLKVENECCELPRYSRVMINRYNNNNNNNNNNNKDHCIGISRSALMYSVRTRHMEYITLDTYMIHDT